LEAALDGEMDAHIADCKDDGQPNRRNARQRKPQDRYWSDNR